MTLIICKTKGYFSQTEADIEIREFKKQHPAEYAQTIADGEKVLKEYIPHFDL